LIEGIFRGIVFIIFDYCQSTIRLLLSPGRGCVTIVRRLYGKGSDQVRPYVFLFLSFIVMFSMPPLVEIINKPADRFAYVDLSARETPLRPFYEGLFEQIESKAVFAIIVASVIGVSLYHLGMRGITRIVFANRERQLIAFDSLFYIAGLQIILLGVAYV